jgi:hypothetical protein
VTCLEADQRHVPAQIYASVLRCCGRYNTLLACFCEGRLPLHLLSRSPLCPGPSDTLPRTGSIKRVVSHHPGWPFHGTDTALWRITVLLRRRGEGHSFQAIFCGDGNHQISVTVRGRKTLNYTLSGAMGKEPLVVVNDGYMVGGQTYVEFHDMAPNWMACWKASSVFSGADVVIPRCATISKDVMNEPHINTALDSTMRSVSQSRAGRLSPL